MKNTYFLRSIVKYCIYFCLLLIPNFTCAAEKDVKASVVVAAQVPSRVCSQYSSFTTNVSKVLADGSQKAIFTAKIYDCDQKPYSSVPLKITSNRGEIDKINFLKADGSIATRGSGLGISAASDENGFAFFAVFSRVPGEATFNLIADGEITIGTLKVKFLPLPREQSVIISVEVPKIISPSGKITIFNPGKLDIDEENLVNLTSEFVIPIWIFYLILFSILTNFLFFAVILILLLRLKKWQKLEINTLQEEKNLLSEEASAVEKIAEAHNQQANPSETLQSNSSNYLDLKNNYQANPSAITDNSVDNSTGNY